MSIPVDAEAIAAAVRDSRMTARDVVEAALERVEAGDEGIRAFVRVDVEQALADAEAVDLRHDRFALPLAGVPIGVKDVHDAAGYPTTYGSTLFADPEPAAVDSAVVGRFKRAGAVVVGKTNTPAFGWQPDTDGLLHGRTANPWSRARSAGGSSGGSAAAVATGMVPLATGSDVGGSVRIPASVCGVCGFVPTAGRSEVTLGPADSLLVRDGPLGASVADVALAATTLLTPPPGRVGRRPRVLGWTASPDGGPVDPEIASVTERAARVYAERLGADLVDMGEMWEDPMDMWLPLTVVPMLEIAAPRNGPRPEVEKGLAALLDRFENLPAGAYADVERRGRRFGDRLRRVFRRVDLVLTPVTAGRAPADDGRGLIGADATRAWVRFTYPWNLAGCPVGSVPAGLDSDGMPVGLHVAGPLFGDERVLAAMATVESCVGRFRPAAHDRSGEDPPGDVADSHG